MKNIVNIGKHALIGFVLVTQVNAYGGRVKSHDQNCAKMTKKNYDEKIKSKKTISKKNVLKKIDFN